MSTTETITSPDGTKLLLRSWDPPGPAKGAVVLIHGLGEHSGRYEHVGGHLAAADLAVIAPDLRGFGASQGRRAFIRDFDTYLADLDLCVSASRSHGVPVVMLGHSMGGLIALRYAQERNEPDLLILSSPALDAQIPGAKRTAAKVLRRVLPGLSLPNGLSGDQLSRDPEVGEAYFADPLVHTRTTAALGGAMLEAMAVARRGPVPLPTLVIHGEDDPVVLAEFSKPLTRHAGVERMTFPGFRHESFNEGGGTEALAVVTGWIESRLS